MKAVCRLRKWHAAAGRHCCLDRWPLPERPDGTTPYAVVQLRQDNAVASLYNIVGFQTHLKWGEQKRLLSMIPGLENVSIVRYGVMHRNSYLCAPKVLRPTYRTSMMICSLPSLKGVIKLCRKCGQRTSGWNEYGQPHA